MKEAISHILRFHHRPIFKLKEDRNNDGGSKFNYCCVSLVNL